MAGLSTQLASKASWGHTHDVGQVNDVHGVLSGKADHGHRHSAMEIGSLVINGRAAGHNVQDPSAQVYMDALPTIDMAMTLIRGTFANNSQ